MLAPPTGLGLDLTRITIMVRDDVEDVPSQRIFKWLRKKCGLRVVEVLVENRKGR